MKNYLFILLISISVCLFTVNSNSDDSKVELAEKKILLELSNEITIKINKLDQLLNSGLITQQIYDEQAKELLDKNKKIKKLNKLLNDGLVSEDIYIKKANQLIGINDEVIEANEIVKTQSNDDIDESTEVTDSKKIDKKADDENLSNEKIKLAEEKGTEKEKLAEEKRVEEEKLAEKKRIEAEKLAEKKLAETKKQELIEIELENQRKLSLLETPSEIDEADQFIKDLKTFTSDNPNEFEILELSEKVILVRPISDGKWNKKIKSDFNLLKEYVLKSENFKSYFEETKRLLEIENIKIVDIQITLLEKNIKFIEKYIAKNIDNKFIPKLMTELKNSQSILDDPKSLKIIKEKNIFLENFKKILDENSEAIQLANENILLLKTYLKENFDTDLTEQILDTIKKLETAIKSEDLNKIETVNEKTENFYLNEVSGNNFKLTDDVTLFSDNNQCIADIDFYNKNFKSKITRFIEGTPNSDFDDIYLEEKYKKNGQYKFKFIGDGDQFLNYELNKEHTLYWYLEGSAPYTNFSMYIDKKDKEKNNNPKFKSTYDLRKGEYAITFLKDIEKDDQVLSFLLNIIEINGKKINYEEQNLFNDTEYNHSLICEYSTSEGYVNRSWLANNDMIRVNDQINFCSADYPKGSLFEESESVTVNKKKNENIWRFDYENYGFIIDFDKKASLLNFGTEIVKGNCS
jgi:hypothetical protein